MGGAYDSAMALLRKHGQEHVLRFWDGLHGFQKDALLSQVSALDFASLARMREMLGQREAVRAPLETLPAQVVQPSASEREAARRSGEASLRKGEVGVILVAGGQGSRLGFDGPKGMFPLAPITRATLFEIHLRKVLALQRRYAADVPLYIMTSEANDAVTRQFMAEHRRFGLSEDSVRFFTQGMWPALSAEGKILLDRPDHIFMSPDGHGGTLSALRAGGWFDEMAERGLKTLFYFQVDNPLVEIADPVFIGLHLQHRSEMSVKVCAKRDPDEGLGVVAERNGRSVIVEYTELSAAQKRETLPSGMLKFLFGSVAIHVFDLNFMRRESDVPLPLHLAHKKVPCCNDAGSTAQPEKPNAYKFEKFIFDALPDAKRTLNVAFERADEFSPVKNGSGVDSADTARRDMVRKFARWLDAAGMGVPRDPAGEPRHRIEIDPCYALNPGELRAKLPTDFAVTGDVLLKASS
jgi:UDP-N-acetylglucosamine/UDP-N-acetylgalactosamine diphosphorylase